MAILDGSWQLEAYFYTPLAFWIGVEARNRQRFERVTVDGVVGTRLTESLSYSCILPLMPACKMEVDTQRTKVLKKITEMSRQGLV